MSNRYGIPGTTMDQRLANLAASAEARLDNIPEGPGTLDFTAYAYRAIALLADSLSALRADYASLRGRLNSDLLRGNEQRMDLARHLRHMADLLETLAEPY